MSLFTNSCAPISLPCIVGDKHIDPCTCRGYLECQVDTYSFLERRCGLGTAWNHATGFCNTEDEVFIGTGTPICERDNPWSRCMSVSDHYSKSLLEKRCRTPNSGGGGDDGGADNTAAIVGGVLAVLLVIAIAAGLVFWWKYRQGQKSKSSNLGPRSNVQKETKEMEEEGVYDIIDEKSVVPVISNASYGVEMEYDNPAFNNNNKSETGNNYINAKPQHQGPTTSFNKPMDNLSPELSTLGTRRHHLSDSSRDDLSRSISVGGKDILVEDCQGYQVGYPSGTIPRQPSPISAAVGDRYEDDFDYGYDLGKVPLPNDYMELEKTDL